nr:antiviral reverse transcriptase Drt3b [Desulfospira joergensenii]
MLERKYTSFWSLDISKCFDSLYTHSVTWALKTKKHSKETTSSKSTFGNIFDRLMQSLNYNETNGIIIGPEVSRIFSEIIFQQIDCNIEEDAKNSKNKYLKGIHYEIKRYVDDIYIFALSDEICENLYHIIENKLREYKLFLNTNKTTKTKHPFITPLSKSILATKKIINTFIESLTERQTEDESQKTFLLPKKIWKKENLISNFLNDLKGTSIYDSEINDVVNLYSLSAINNFIFNIVENAPHQDILDKNASAFRELFHVLIDISYHLYTVSPSVSSSIKLSTINLLTVNFFSAFIKDESNSIRLKIYEHTKYFLESGWFNKLYHLEDHNFLLEAMNILLSTRIMGSDFMLDHETIKKVFKFKDNKKKIEFDSMVKGEESSNYFQITSLLYYIGNEEKYNQIKSKLLSHIDTKLKDLSDIRINSEMCYLFLDIVACPYVCDNDKKKWVRNLLSMWKGKKPTEESVSEWTTKLSSFPWFISWDHLELFNILERKELLKGY